MALVANLTKDSIAADGSYTILTDSTIYGGANPDRNEVALYLKAYRVDEDLAETAVAVVSFDSEIVTEFQVTNTIDGRYKYNFVIIDNWLIGTTYNQYDLVWSTTENKFYEYINTTPSAGNAVTNLTYFVEVQDPTTKIANVGTSSESGNLIYQVLQTILDYNTAKCYATTVTKFAKQSCGEDDDCGCSSKLGKSVRRLHTLLTVMRIADIRQQYLEGERMARTAEKYCDDCGCLKQ